MGLTVTERSPESLVVPVADVESRLEITGETALLQDLIREVQDLFEHELERPIPRQVYSEALPGLDRRDLVLTVWPLEAESLSVTVDGDSVTDFTTEADRGTLWRESGWPADEDPSRVVVAYAGGWVLPAEVSDWQASTAYAAGRWARPTVRTASPLLFQCTSAGTSAGTEPDWSAAAAGDTVADGSVTWTAKTARELPERLRSLIYAAVRHLHDARPPALKRWKEDVFEEEWDTSSLQSILPRQIVRGLRSLRS